ncbi:MAG: 16S rRNA (adenine(1518)-N(6)/adenine(1519)-N(6))-dimethyltransferase RsmA [Candidatus Giovannonibacteria bacterium]|nr:16S rRNA (adenine(1518)-N(6)/adenine(1519)-N(6))-dimethyltransferase RsmA [Candidatus Giovannonibacteria bacterium]
MLNKQKKFLGQHFLKNKKILEEMARAAEISKKDIVLEVGPGLGSLTEILAERAGKVIAIEKDRDLIPVLREKFKNYKNVEIIEGDILKIKYLPLPLLVKEGIKHYKIVANLPYYITSRFLRLFLSQTRFRSKLMVLMVQKEVAERILARDGKESLLSLSVKAYAKAEIIRRVSKNFFSPPPKVDSAIIKLTPYPQTPFPLRKGKGGDVEKILAVAKIAFQQKRKMLRHSLSRFNLNNLEEYGNKRPEELSFKDWVHIHTLIVP